MKFYPNLCKLMGHKWELDRKVGILRWSYGCFRCQSTEVRGVKWKATEIAPKIRFRRYEPSR